MRTLEDDLKAYYRSRRVSADLAVKAAVADGVARECADIRAERDVAFDGMPLSAAEKIRCGQVADYAAFVAGQARFMGVRSWLLQAAVVALVVFVSWADPSGTMGLFACLAGAAIAVCGLPDIFASRMCGLIELERSCKFNARSVAVRAHDGAGMCKRRGAFRFVVPHRRRRRGCFGRRAGLRAVLSYGGRMPCGGTSHGRIGRVRCLGGLGFDRGGGCLWFGNQVLLGLRDGFLVDMGDCRCCCGGMDAFRGAPLAFRHAVLSQSSCFRFLVCKSMSLAGLEKS